jgi:hypothetical protein
VFYFFTQQLSAQIKDNMVRDTALYRKLYCYLDLRRVSWLEDSTGKKIELQEFLYRSISVRNLKTDSIIADKSLIGIYAFSFSNPSEKPWLYINHGHRIEFLELDKLKLKKTINKILRFFRRHPKEFTLLDQLTTIKNVTIIIDTNKHHESWHL